MRLVEVMRRKCVAPADWPGRPRSRSPGTACDRGSKGSQIGHGKSERALLLGALISRHQHLDHSDTVVEGESGSLETEERADEVAVLRLVAVRHRLRWHHGHHSGLGILLLDEILSLGTLHGAREEESQP